MSDNRTEYAEFLQRILNGDTSFSLLKQSIPAEKRGFFNMLFMTALRRLTFIKETVLPHFIKKKVPQKQQILECILYLGTTELLFMDTPAYAVLNSYAEAAKKLNGKFGANFVNAVLRNILRNKGGLLSLPRDKYFSHDFLKILKQDYTPDEISAMGKFAEYEPPLDITLKDQTVNPLNDGQVLFTGTVRMPSNVKVTELPGYEEGKWWVQDAASALAVKCLPEIKGKNVLDICAAPGGKTAQLLAGGAVVTAVDISEQRLDVLRENMMRLKLMPNLTTVCADALSYTPSEKFDIILIDAPCSATGTFRRHPEIMHTKTAEDVRRQEKLQRSILQHAANFLTPGGMLLYATCSLAKAEGERQIKHFIAKHQEFAVFPITLAGTENLRTKEGFIRVLPQRFLPKQPITDENMTEKNMGRSNLTKKNMPDADQTGKDMARAGLMAENMAGADGFFIACLQRKI